MASLRLKYSRSRSPRNAPSQGHFGSFDLNEPQGMPGIDVMSAGAAMNGAERIREERKQQMHVANFEIDELKNGLRYAEFKLASVIQEKEKLEKETRSHAYQVGDLNMKLRQRDIEFQQKDEMFRQLEGALMQKDFE